MSGSQEGQSRMSFAAECNHELLMFTKRREYINSRVCFYRLIPLLMVYQCIIRSTQHEGASNCDNNSQVRCTVGCMM